MSNNEINRCRICGLDQEEPPWGDDGRSPQYIICHCCGVDSGYEDYTVESCRIYRQIWLAKGSQWMFSKYKPDSWSLQEQLKHIPRKFL